MAAAALYFALGAATVVAVICFCLWAGVFSWLRNLR